MAIKVGDIVRLKSGGVKMVVSHFSQSGDIAQCYWQNVDGESAEACNFAYPVVTLAPDAEAGATEKTEVLTSNDDLQLLGDAQTGNSRRTSWLSSRS